MDKMICNKCGIEKNLDQYKKGRICIDCVREKAREYSREYRKENPEKVRITNNKYNEKNREYIRERDKAKLANPETGNRIRERARNNYIKYREDPKKRIIHNTRTKITKVLKGLSKSLNTIELIGCDGQFLKNWLEYHFDSHMSWENYGSYWHIDHVIPCESFDIENNEELKRCFNWKNLRPLEGSENISKSSKIIIKDIINQEIKVHYYLTKVLTTTL